MESIEMKIKRLRKERHWTQEQLAEKLGVTNPAVCSWEKGTAVPTYDKISKLAQIFNVPISTLLDDNNAIYSSISIPVLGKVQAGIPTEAIQEILDYEEIDRSTAITGEYFALQVKGRSMAPRINPGDVVIVRKQSMVENGQVAIVLVDGEDATIKKVVRQTDGIFLIPFNQDFDPIFYSNDQIEKLPVVIIGRVVECRQKY